ncbi:acyl-CoA dehydrogenase family protein [Mycobacterium sp. CVI_P3]|uniref:Acyl-CoA dehydrogenase family protein n=1 Tax=Mycobacterium pinniadriaticum TaxID=2994102 RepID=A0ABT3SFQ2_9MYCO|nr:acyl-CoA dehydrogenase family protein [Mycobacterium pinniadriaticum]MCX2931645.1 acyl-CoA dehydrogenase family protein [Mycobacterium pinniadriaticum]MCX2937963.1 acyl-CoA dehydrogenase family protein [Mycobacterium pinniadriaticum]
MNTLSVQEAQDLARATRDACERLATDERIREVGFALTDPRRRGFDRRLWQVLCSQIGITEIALPAHLGGAGCGSAMLSTVAHELGRCLAPVPLVASLVLATGLIADCAGAGKPPLDEGNWTALMKGERTAAAVITTDGGPWSPDAVNIVASADGRGDATLTGTGRHVLHAGAADDLVVVALADGEPAIYLLAADVDGVMIIPEHVLDATRPMATVHLDRAPAIRLRTERPVHDVIERRIQHAIAVLSAEQVGTTERVLEMSVEYASTRKQFGRPIGTFQSIKHRCADMLLDLEWSRSASQAALQAIDDDPPGSAAESAWRCGMAKAVCSESLRSVSKQNLQIHGGIGFTWEHAAHLYLKRARTDEVLFGTPSVYWDRIATTAGVFEEKIAACSTPI